MATLESTQSSADVLADDNGPAARTDVIEESTSADSSFSEGEDVVAEGMEVQPDDVGDQSDDMLLADGDSDNGAGKRVKVKE